MRFLRTSSTRRYVSSFLRTFLLFTPIQKRRTTARLVNNSSKPHVFSWGTDIDDGRSHDLSKQRTWPFGCFAPWPAAQRNCSCILASLFPVDWGRFLAVRARFCTPVWLDFFGFDCITARQQKQHHRQHQQRQQR